MGYVQSEIYLKLYLTLKFRKFCEVLTWLAYIRIRYARPTHNGKYQKDFNAETA